MLMLAILAAITYTLIGGQPSTQDYSVILKINNKGTCTGSVIADKVVLTAAHCIYGLTIPSPISVFVKDNQYLSTDYTTLPGYPQDNDRDIALLFFKDNLPVTPISVIDKPIDSSYIGREASIAGYGYTSYSDGVGSGDGQYSGSQTIDDVIPESFLLRKTNTAISCFGDSGGGWVIDNTLIGINSRGDCTKFSLAIQVGLHVQWINEELAKRGLPKLGVRSVSVEEPKEGCAIAKNQLANFTIIILCIMIMIWMRNDS